MFFEEQNWRHIFNLHAVTIHVTKSVFRMEKVGGVHGTKFVFGKFVPKQRPNSGGFKK